MRISADDGLLSRLFLCVGPLGRNMIVDDEVV